MRVCLAVLVLGPLVGCAAGPPPPPVAVASNPTSGSAIDGLLLAERNCSACHAIGQVGESRIPEAPTFVGLAGKYAGSSLATVISEGIASGHPSMPRWIFRPSEVASLLAYLGTLGADEAS